MDEVARKQRLVLITWSGKSHSAQSET
jgi:hypothetical protein